MSRQYSGHYVCTKCNWKSDLVIFGYLHGWKLKERLKKLIKEYEEEFGKEYLKKKLFLPFLGGAIEKGKFELALSEAKELFSEKDIKITKNKILIRNSIKDIILKSHSWHWRFSYQCKKCFNIFLGIPDILESKKSGINKRRCPKCKSYGEEIRGFSYNLFCPMCKTKGLKFHKNRMLIA